MKNMKVIDKGKLLELLEFWGHDYTVIVPFQDNGNLLFGDLNNVALSTAFNGRPVVSLKEHLFPQREKIFTFNTSDNSRVAVQDHLDYTRRIIWGIRPCDLKGIETLDAIFLSGYVDNYYEIRRKNTVLMGLNCNEPCDTCFCAFCQAGPFAKDGFDLLFTDLGGSYLVQIGSELGEALAGKSPGFFTPATDAAVAKANSLAEASRQAFKTTVQTDLARQKLANLPEWWDNIIWQEESATCMLCGGCNFVCPACHCFNIDDITGAEGISTRIRYWDSCQLGGFTQMAAENTRNSRAERLRQRIFHKFVYIPAKYHGVPGCTGCGRCIEACPAEIDITRILERITRNG